MSRARARKARRRQPWPRAAGQLRDQTRESAANYGEALREALRKLEFVHAGLAAQRPPDAGLLAAVGEVVLSVAFAALGLDDIQRWMAEAAQAEGDEEEGEPPT